MKKIILILIAALGISVNSFKAEAQTNNYVFISTMRFMQDSTTPTIAKDSTYLATPVTALHPKNDSISWVVTGAGSKTQSKSTDSLIMPIPFPRAGVSYIMDIGIRCDSIGLDSVQIYQNNFKIFTYSTGGHFKTADVFFPIVASQFILPDRIVVKPIMSRSSSKGRRVWISPRYYIQQ